MNRARQGCRGHSASIPCANKAYTPEKFGVVDHIELDSGDRTPLPVTETGYRSHHVYTGTVAEYGSAVAYVTTWLDHEAQRTRWDGTQLSLF